MFETWVIKETGSQPSPGFGRVVISLVVVLVFSHLLGACAHDYRAAPFVDDLPALQLPEGEVDSQAALVEAQSADMLVLTPEMRQFADRYVRHGSQRQRLVTLHQSLRSPALLDVRYDFEADGTAAQAFASGKANCLSYAHLFVALARYAGLNARYQSLTLRPEWTRHGDRVALRRHVNVRVDLRGGEQYMVDLDPVSRERISSAEVISDDEAAALFHANLAMNALLDGDKRKAYVQAVRALQLAPRIDYLWVNLGAIYRQAGQDEAAERVYQAALAVNPDSRPAMNNLAVLYHEQGELEKSRLWEEKVRRHRDRNPYYHYYLGELAEAAGDLDGALQHFLAAIAIKKSDAEFYFRVARVYYAQHRREQTIQFLERAIEHSRLVGEREEYRAFLLKVSEDTLAYSEDR